MRASTRATTCSHAVFKTCNNCNTRWSSLDAFLNDPTVDLVGYMPTFDDLVHGLFLFNHHCGTTLASEVGLFTHLYDGPVYRENKYASGDCPGYCQNQSDFSSCPAKCNCAYVRETLRVIKDWPKSDYV